MVERATRHARRGHRCCRSSMTSISTLSKPAAINRLLQHGGSASEDTSCPRLPIRSRPLRGPPSVSWSWLWAAAGMMCVPCLPAQVATTTSMRSPRPACCSGVIPTRATSCARIWRLESKPMTSSDTSHPSCPRLQRSKQSAQAWRGISRASRVSAFDVMHLLLCHLGVVGVKNLKTWS
jgi:hypothetical protein